MRLRGHTNGALLRVLATTSLLALTGCQCGPFTPVFEVDDAGISSDSGVLDAGAAADPGTSDAGLADAGACSVVLHAPAVEVAKTPRPSREAEYLIIESTGQFVADDDAYARVSRELDFVERSDAGGLRPFVLPTWESSLNLEFDDAGATLVAAGQFHEWDCLNEAYRGTPNVSPFGGGRWGSVSFDGMLQAPTLLGDYAALAHVIHAEVNGVGLAAICGAPRDICLAVDGGTHVLLGYVQSDQCANTWFRLVTFADGGQSFVVRDAGASAQDWRVANPACTRNLWGYWLYDGGS